MKKRREEHISRCEMRANWILSTFFSTSYYYEHTPQQLTYSAGLKKLFLSTTKTQPPTSSYSPKQQSCCFVVLHRISRKQQNSFVVRPRTNLNAILRSTLKTSGQNLNNTQWLTHDDAHRGGQKKTWKNMADDASQRKFQSVTVKTFTPLPIVRFLILLNVVAVGRRRCTRPSFFPPTFGKQEQHFDEDADWFFSLSK